MFLSCLDFNLQAKDCEGNTCLHYAAITGKQPRFIEAMKRTTWFSFYFQGNCEIADLLMRAAEKINLRLDQIANREGSLKSKKEKRYRCFSFPVQVVQQRF